MPIFIKYWTNERKLHNNIVPVQLPIGAEDNFKGVVDLVKMKALIFESDTGKINETDIPADMMDDVENYKEELIEAAAEANDELLTKYLEGEELTDAEILEGIKDATINGSTVFVFCGSALNNIGIKPFMDFIIDCSATRILILLLRIKIWITNPWSLKFSRL